MPKSDTETIFLTTSPIFPWALSAKGSLEEAVPLSGAIYLTLSPAELGLKNIYRSPPRGIDNKSPSTWSKYPKLSQT